MFNSKSIISKPLKEIIDKYLLRGEKFRRTHEKNNINCGIDLCGNKSVRTSTDQQNKR